MKEHAVPTLALLFGAYFHQDWQIDAMSPLDNVKLFADGEAGSVGAARAELDLLLDAGMTEEELREFVVRRLRSFYDLTLVGKRMRTWLEEVRDALS